MVNNRDCSISKIGSAFGTCAMDHKEHKEKAHKGHKEERMYFITFESLALDEAGCREGCSMRISFRA